MEFIDDGLPTSLVCKEDDGKEAGDESRQRRLERDWSAEKSTLCEISPTLMVEGSTPQEGGQRTRQGGAFKQR